MDWAPRATTGVLVLNFPYLCGLAPASDDDVLAVWACHPLGLFDRDDGVVRAGKKKLGRESYVAGSTQKATITTQLPRFTC